MIGDIIEVDILELNIQFEGVGFYNNKKVCVKNVLPGEKVKAKIIFEKPNFVSAKLVEIIVKNPLRIEPKCKYYNICGGCTLQILEPKDALKLKGEIIKKYFSSLFGGEVKLFESKNSFFYRNKIAFAVENGVVGLRQENSKKIVEIDTCSIANKRVNELLLILKKWVRNNNINFDIKYFVIREFSYSFILTIICKNKVKDLKTVNELVAFLKNNFKEPFGVFLNYNLNEKEIFGKDWQHIYGLKGLDVKLCNLNVNIHPYSFLQVNYYTAEKLYERVLNYISSDDFIVEGYSGAGILSSLMAKKAKKVCSIEINKNATMDANILKENNNLINLCNINGDFSKVIKDFGEDIRNAVVVLDPPQSGCQKEVLNCLIENKIKKVIYISCNPYTLKQNVYYLKNYYEVKNLELFDMFPNTSHIESLCVLERKEKY